MARNGWCDVARPASTMRYTGPQAGVGPMRPELEHGGVAEYLTAWQPGDASLPSAWV